MKPLTIKLYGSLYFVCCTFPRDIYRLRLMSTFISPQTTRPCPLHSVIGQSWRSLSLHTAGFCLLHPLTTLLQYGLRHRKVTAYPSRRSDWVRAIAVSADGRSLPSESRNMVTTVRLWHFPAQKQVLAIEHPQRGHMLHQRQKNAQGRNHRYHLEMGRKVYRFSHLAQFPRIYDATIV